MYLRGIHITTRGRVRVQVAKHNHYVKGESDQKQMSLARLSCCIRQGIDIFSEQYALYFKYHSHHKNGRVWDDQPNNLMFIYCKEHARLHKEMKRELYES